MQALILRQLNDGVPVLDIRHAFPDNALTGCEKVIVGSAPHTVEFNGLYVSLLVISSDKTVRVSINQSLDEQTGTLFVLCGAHVTSIVLRADEAATVDILTGGPNG